MARKPARGDSSQPQKSQPPTSQSPKAKSPKNDELLWLETYFIVFPQDREKWFERSRFIKVVRASQDGSFRASSLPPGDYYVAATVIAGESVEATTPEVLERLVPRAVRAMLDEGAERRVEIQLQ